MSGPGQRCSSPTRTKEQRFQGKEGPFFSPNKDLFLADALNYCTSLKKKWTARWFKYCGSTNTKERVLQLCKNVLTQELICCVSSGAAVIVSTFSVHKIEVLTLLLEFTYLKNLLKVFQKKNWSSWDDEGKLDHSRVKDVFCLSVFEIAVEWSTCIRHKAYI